MQQGCPRRIIIVCECVFVSCVISHSDPARSHTHNLIFGFSLFSDARSKVAPCENFLNGFYSYCIYSFCFAFILYTYRIKLINHDLRSGSARYAETFTPITVATNIITAAPSHCHRMCVCVCDVNK